MALVWSGSMGMPAHCEQMSWQLTAWSLALWLPVMVYAPGLLLLLLLPLVARARLLCEGCEMSCQACSAARCPVHADCRLQTAEPCGSHALALHAGQLLLTWPV